MSVCTWSPSSFWLRWTVKSRGRSTRTIALSDPGRSEGRPQPVGGPPCTWPRRPSPRATLTKGTACIVTVGRLAVRTDAQRLRHAVTSRRRTFRPRREARRTGRPKWVLAVRQPTCRATRAWTHEAKRWEALRGWGDVQTASGADSGCLSRPMDHPRRERRWRQHVCSLGLAPAMRAVWWPGRRSGSTDPATSERRSRGVSSASPKTPADIWGGAGRRLRWSLWTGNRRRAFEGSSGSVLVVRRRAIEIRRVVIGIDRSQNARRAVDFAARLDRDGLKQVTVVCVVEPKALQTAGLLPSSVRVTVNHSLAVLNKQLMSRARREVDSGSRPPQTRWMERSGGGEVRRAARRATPGRRGKGIGRPYSRCPSGRWRQARAPRERRCRGPEPLVGAGACRALMPRPPGGAQWGRRCRKAFRRREATFWLLRGIYPILDLIMQVEEIEP